MDLLKSIRHEHDHLVGDSIGLKAAAAAAGMGFRQAFAETQVYLQLRRSGDSEAKSALILPEALQDQADCISAHGALCPASSISSIKKMQFDGSVESVFSDPELSESDRLAYTKHPLGWPAVAKNAVVVSVYMGLLARSVGFERYAEALDKAVQLNAAHDHFLPLDAVVSYDWLQQAMKEAPSILELELESELSKKARQMDARLEARYG